MNETLSRATGLSVAGSSDETKAIAEVQAKMILARNFPRDVKYCLEMILIECDNPELAQQAIYEFPRGDSVVRGASIRLVECVSRHWGNIISGVTELGTVGNRASVRAYCWDLQTNFMDEKVFDVEYVRHTKKGDYPLTDPRDKYEMLANQGARRKRACIQAVIPKFVIDKAMEKCSAVLEASVNKGGKSIDEVKGDMLMAFSNLADWIGPDELASVCGRDFDKLGPKDIVKLRNLYNAIKDGFVRPEAAFNRETTPEKPSVEESEKLDALNASLAGGDGNA